MGQKVKPIGSASVSTDMGLGGMLAEITAVAA